MDQIMEKLSAASKIKNRFFNGFMTNDDRLMVHGRYTTGKHALSH